MSFTDILGQRKRRKLYLCTESSGKGVVISKQDYFFSSFWIEAIKAPHEMTVFLIARGS